MEREATLPDFYGKQLKLYLLKFLRHEQKFDGIESLMKQINLDVAEAKKFLNMSALQPMKPPLTKVFDLSLSSVDAFPNDHFQILEGTDSDSFWLETDFDNLKNAISKLT